MNMYRVVHKKKRGNICFSVNRNNLKS